MVIRMASNLAKIKGDSNSVFQNTVLNNPTIVIGSTESISLLASAGRYDVIQSLFQQQMEQIKQAHPLSDYFSVTPLVEGNYSRLISTPKTAEALLKYPMSLKGNMRFDKSDCPGIGEDESPWEYSYRTQKEILVDTFDLKEFLGDVENPFPMVKLNNAKMKMIPPPFPEPIKAVISAGDNLFNAAIQRVPSTVYKELVFIANTSDIPLSIKIVLHENPPLAQLVFSRTESSSVGHLLAGEKFLEQVRCNKKIEITSNEILLFSVPISENDLQNDFLSPKPELLRFLENLIKIEKRLGCQFNYSGNELMWDDYVLSHVFVASLDNKAHLNNTDFDSFHIGRTKIKEDIMCKTLSEECIMSLEYEGAEFEFYGVSFSFDKLISQYQNAKINNLASVKKNLRRKKKNILFTLKPLNESDGRIKNYRMFINLRATLSSEPITS